MVTLAWPMDSLSRVCDRKQSKVFKYFVTHGPLSKVLTTNLASLMNVLIITSFSNSICSTHPPTPVGIPIRSGSLAVEY